MTKRYDSERGSEVNSGSCSLDPVVRKSRIDCSKLSNGSDAAAIVGVIIMFAIVALGIWLSVTGNEFWAGALMATLMFKFEPWIVRPLARLFSTNNEVSHER
jgi:hypothetical protein